ncbi:MAG: HD domain-containing protein, partial [Lachnospiraceae bacterium]|nr:HD domain-containing protein [Lachnospiraceae bacterium]
IKAAPMHDLGKVAIDDAVLRKPGKYTDAEYAEMKRHSAEGARIVESILKGVEDDAFVEVAKNVAYYHHEKWNGFGYPTGKTGTDIPVEARIMALADVFDALVSKRCYKEAFSYDEAFHIIEEALGQHFDPDLGKVFMECRPELEAFYDKNK